jgi:hypothetical protein
VWCESIARQQDWMTQAYSQQSQPCVWCESIARQQEMGQMAAQVNWQQQTPEQMRQGLLAASEQLGAGVNACESRARAKEGGSMVPMEKCSACGTVATDDGGCWWCSHLKNLSIAQSRIAELEQTCAMHRRADKTVEDLVKSCNDMQQRNMRLSDYAGGMLKERDELLKENAMLRREVERLERKARR